MLESAQLKALRRFADILQSHIGRPSNSRPFVCDGSPLLPSVLIVGANAAADTGVNFWRHWTNLQGFDKKAWCESYKVERSNQRTKKQKRKSELSRTRSALKIIGEKLPTENIIETNIWSIATERLSELKSPQRTTGPFELLLRSGCWKLIVTHGKDARDYMQANHPGTHVESCKRHLSKLSFSAVESFGGHLASVISSQVKG